MPLFNIFKKKKEGERFQKKQKKKSEIQKADEIKEKEEKTEKKDLKKVSGVLLAPHVTEKATFIKEKNVHIFKISPRANKTMVRQAIKNIYGVVPQKVNIVYASSKKRFIRGKYGTRTGFKKAIVFLKEGDKITE